MLDEVTKKHPYNFSRKTWAQLVGFIILFAIFLAIISGLITHFFGSGSNYFVELLTTHETSALIFYFVYVVVASVIIPIPTLPLDIVFLKLVDPASVITIRLLGGLGGGTISFYLARNYGHGLLKKWLSSKNYTYVDSLSKNINWLQFFIIAMVPIVNAELMAYAGGLSKLRFRMVMSSLAIAIFYRLLFVFFVIQA